jgi:HSP20 family protein
MARSQALEVQEKKELVSKEEKTVPARYYVPNTDIYETEDGLTVVMEIPGVEKKDPRRPSRKRRAAGRGADRFRQV